MILRTSAFSMQALPRKELVWWVYCVYINWMYNKWRCFKRPMIDAIKSKTILVVKTYQLLKFRCVLLMFLLYACLFAPKEIIVLSHWWNILLPVLKCAYQSQWWLNSSYIVFLLFTGDFAYICRHLCTTMTFTTSPLRPTYQSGSPAQDSTMPSLMVWLTGYMKVIESMLSSPQYCTLPILCYFQS